MIIFIFSISKNFLIVDIESKIVFFAFTEPSRVLINLRNLRELLKNMKVRKLKKVRKTH